MVTNTILAEQLFMAGNLEWEGVVPKAGLCQRGLLKSLMIGQSPSPFAPGAELVSQFSLLLGACPTLPKMTDLGG
jgi:hypothetical protein